MAPLMTMANLNIGLLGHVDSGKTSLARALSTIASTAAFDKSPESRRRGITLDLGFSACDVPTVNIAPTLHAAGINHVQCTLVDCPGHASLIRTILGGAQIIDIMILVIDACKGIQTQTAECLVIGEILCKPLVVVINKIDAVQGGTQEEKQMAIVKLKKRLQKTFERTRWPVVPIVEVAAAPRGDTNSENEVSKPINVMSVLSAVLSLADAEKLKEQLETPLRSEEFVMMFDHCFALKGQGTVFTGTVIRGQVEIGDNILVSESNVVRKVKGLQVFHKPVQCARRGDRVGLCVVQFDAEGIERGLLCSAQSSRKISSITESPLFESASVMIAEVNRVRFHQMPCDTHTKFHITIGHSTVMGTMKYFSRPTLQKKENGEDCMFDFTQESLYVEELEENSCFDFDNAETQVQPGLPVSLKRGDLTYYAIILLEKPIMAIVGTPLIAARLDMERENMCRIAIAGTVRAIMPSDTSGGSSIPLWRTLPVVRYKTRELVVERVVNERTCIASGVVLSNTSDGNNGEGRRGGGGGGGGGINSSSNNNNNNNKVKEKDTLHAEVQKFIGLRVHFRSSSVEQGDADGEVNLIEGVIDSAFGKTGKVKLLFNDPIFAVDNDAKMPTAAATKTVAGEAVRKKRNEVTFLTDGVIELTIKKNPLAIYSQLQQ
ncbi:selenocysteine-tRNA-specific elongation factor [Trypanosoma theileri]|uniref:Selenocysteine-specific elongation factor n=1 Tax=Trypanosoma theileri TaxID=67003 RepID=A0A1X0PAN1_9TRYP|nr:selenocysteine-tRNA-specific elongation factor [Trypanosoma theileri]ORC93683.1 selenocysteine-tRNA-specific elongation factor [Trypanosoma theileri]